MSYAFVKLGMIDYVTFLNQSRKMMLLNSQKLNLTELNTILLCASRLTRIDTDRQQMFDPVMMECLEIVLE